MDGSSVWIDLNEFTESDNLSLEPKEDDGCVYICCDPADFAPMVTPRYLCVVVTPPKAVEVIDFDLDNNPLLRIIHPKEPVTLEKYTSATSPISSPPFGEVTPMAPQAKEAAETIASPVLPAIRPFIG